MTTTATSEFPKLTGRQEPENLSEFEGDDTDGLRAVEFARKTRTVPLPWQAASLIGILRRAADGMWTHPDVLLLVPRQNGKTLILVLRCLFGLFLLNEKIVFSSQRWQTSKNTYKRLSAIIKSRPSLNKRVVANSMAPGSAYIELASGAQITFITRSNDSGRGLDEVDLVIYDEAYNLTESETSGLSWTQMASKNPQTIYASSAANAEQHINCAVLAGQRRRGLEHGAGLYFAEYMAPDGDWDDLETARQANPSFGVIQTDAKMLKEIRAVRTAAARRSFEVEALGRGIWPTDGESHEAIIDAEAWSTMKNLTPRLTGPIALGLDRSVDGKTWALAAAQRTADGRVHIEIGFHQAASLRAVAAYIRAVVSAWDPAVLVIDRKSSAMSVVPLLAEEGIEPEVTGTPQMAMACQGFLDDAADARLSHAGQQIFTDAVAAAAKRTMPQGDFVWDRTEGSVAALLAGTIARWALLTFGTETSRGTATPEVVRERGGRAAELDVLAEAF
ncbi:terminase large subunit [Gordonia sp. ABSL1-1]|uniref:terminase large subunit domain-containing protein n=1 Tax=Gordonia sp. ABSL1-1 TaxID=3053923 RepID=UPI00257470E0|nr:terminase large subunit [Gordonia sp. ABSL1-1]MDL9938693.1 terminase large subunit [Gordonia sp. ABSL1-1]